MSAPDWGEKKALISISLKGLKSAFEVKGSSGQTLNWFLPHEVIRNTSNPLGGQALLEKLLLWIQKTLITGPMFCILFCTILDPGLLLLVLDWQTHGFRYLSHCFFSLYNQRVWKKGFSSYYISFCLCFFRAIYWSLLVWKMVFNSYQFLWQLSLKTTHHFSHQQITLLMNLIKTKPVTIKFSLLADGNLKRGILISHLGHVTLYCTVQKSSFFLNIPEVPP